MLFFLLFVSYDTNAASNNIPAKVGNNLYDSLEDAISASNSNDIIVLTNDIQLNNTLEINETVNINLNNNIIKSKNKVFLVEGGSLNLTGKSKIIETESYYSVITLVGFASYNIDGAYIEGVESGLGIKSGIFNINNATIIGTGSDKTPTSGNNNSINASGTAIQIESNIGYKGNIVLNIKDGNFTSNNSNVLYEYVVNGNDTKIKDINISGGKFISKNGKNVVEISNTLKSTHPKFISGGVYSSDVSDHLKDGFVLEKSNNLYEVVVNTISTFKEKESSKNIAIYIIFTILSICSIVTYMYIKKKH